MYQILSTKNVTFNYHKKCITRDTFNNEINLKNNFNILSINNDKNGIEFISTFESKKYPIYGVMFHPEKNNYEFVNQKPLHQNIPHDYQSILVSQYFSNFFVNECRKNNNKYNIQNDSIDYPLIYNFKPEHTIDYESFEQMYFFERQK